ncbi:MAG: hypothetical protein EOS48_12135 [Mesorhizobium sp.]|nr:MAG: hypothetical protein EOS48_12135 [Mesorhizobium sp.]
MGRRGEPVKAAVAPLEAIGPSLLSRLPSSAHDRTALAPGIAHIGVGASHRCFAGSRGLADWIAANDDFRTAVTASHDGLLCDDPMAQTALRIVDQSHG